MGRKREIPEKILAQIRAGRCFILQSTPVLSNRPRSYASFRVPPGFGLPGEDRYEITMTMLTSGRERHYTYYVPNPPREGVREELYRVEAEPLGGG